MTSGEQLPDPATAIAPSMPSVSPRIRLADSVKPRHHCLKACPWKRRAPDQLISFVWIFRRFLPESRIDDCQLPDLPPLV
jgi:hypothetical protein